MGMDPLPRDLILESFNFELINRNIVCIAQSRSGTGSICQFFAKLGVWSYHELPAADLKDGLDNFVSLLLMNRPSFILDNASGFMLMKKIETILPETRFMVMIRDPVTTCNSQRHTLRTTIDPRYTDDLYHYTDGWIRTYHQLYKQIEVMNHKPFFVEFEKYITGAYNSLFLRIFGIKETPQLQFEMLRHLLTRINTNYKYDKVWIGDNRYKICMDIWDRLEMLCKDNWLEKDLAENPPEIKQGQKAVFI